jgi:hypothetical protein
MFSPDNLDEVVARPDPELGLMRNGPLLAIMRASLDRSQPTPPASD